MKFQLFLLNRTALHIAVDKGNIEAIKALLSHPDINVNIKTVL